MWYVYLVAKRKEREEVDELQSCRREEKKLAEVWKRPVHVPPSHPTLSCLRVSTVGSSRGHRRILSRSIKKRN